ncbi:MAG: nucleotidyltransferase substrate binding protein [Oligoflexia bacterium]|nr:nucleotidyltransferase substrate binding protein [Oligoflexia bacterium]
MIIESNIDISSLLDAHKSLKEAIAQPKNDFIRDSVIQRFECTYELTWKTFKRILTGWGKVVNSPKPIFREIFHEGFIDNLDQWFGFADARNETVHTYNRKTAENVYQVALTFSNELNSVISKLVTLAINRLWRQVLSFFQNNKKAQRLYQLP